MTSSHLLWQLADSAFPTGGFAHSGGLEAAFALGEVTNAVTLERHLRHAVEQAGRSALPLVTAAHTQPERLLALDRLCDAATLGHVANRASRAQGQAWLTTAAAAFATPALVELKARCRREHAACHLTTVFGAVCGLVGLGREETQRLFLFLHLRGLVSSAVRLSVVGPMEAQGIQQRLGPVLDSVWERCRTLDAGNLAQTAPLLDLVQGHHDRLYSRLFSS